MHGRMHAEACADACGQVLEYGYGFLATVSRSPIVAFGIPTNRLLEVGLSYEV